ncbi:MAG: light-harvesting protein [Alphaproteobacteria bacterium]|nr:light-harvesting protein [Alphaproteobacteria bacterium]
MASDGSAASDSMSGLTAAQAQEFHKAFMGSFLGFTGIAVVAHILVWTWRPWIPGPNGYASLESTFASIGTFLTNLV